MAEMISTEREYVRYLGYVINNYFPEMERADLPRDFCGKSHVIFGNEAELHDFQGQHFLMELECCGLCPLAVGQGFLRHEEQLGLYVLYSKNKPQADALLHGHGNTFFKDKQWELGHKMDLDSYLLKPMQHMGKYALLLQDLVKEAGLCPAQQQELGEQGAAKDVVRFQLHHNNDLLTVDAIRDCDVNLKEQGPLRCQDAFIICCGRRKYLRQVLPFEDPILFSKTTKTAEIRMMENVGDSSLRFKIWFYRWKSQDTYILQASSAEAKTTWTDVIRKILRRQALRNRELRMQEVVCMGMGNKLFVDIKPSDATRSDQAANYITKETESQTQMSTAVPAPGGQAAPFKRPHSTISESSTSSCSSQPST